MRYENNKRIRDKRIFRLKKAVAVCLAFFIVFALATVDRNCGEMVGNDVRVIPRIVYKGNNDAGGWFVSLS